MADETTAPTSLELAILAAKLEGGADLTLRERVYLMLLLADEADRRELAAVGPLTTERFLEIAESEAQRWPGTLGRLADR